MTDEIKIERKTFEALASETRISILKTLDVRQMTITELSKGLGLAKSTIHEHLSKMADAGLVEKIVDHRKWSYYKLTYKGKRILHPHEMVKIMLILSTSILAFIGGVFEIINFYFALRAREMAVGTEYAEKALQEAPSEAIAEPNFTVLLIGGFLLTLAFALGYTALKRWKTFRS